jgi:hypothetical protein
MTCPEQIVLDAIRDHLAASSENSIWIGELYAAVGGLKFARPREFEELLALMFATGLIHVEVATLNLGSAGKTQRVTDVSLGWAHLPTQDRAANTH